MPGTPLPADTFVTHLGKIERVSAACNRVNLCTQRNGDLEVVASLVIPMDCFRQILDQLNEAAPTILAMIN